MKSRKGLMVLALTVVLGALAGCGSPTPPAGGGGGGTGTATSTANNQQLDLPGKIAKRVQFLDYSNEMKQLAQFYYMYHLERKKSPASVKEFQDYIKRDSGQLVKWMNEGYYDIIINQKPDSNTIVVYQKRDLKGGTRWVAKGDASIHEITEAEWEDYVKKLYKNLKNP